MNYNVRLTPVFSISPDHHSRLTIHPTVVQIRFFYDSAKPTPASTPSAAIFSARAPCGAFYSTSEGSKHLILRLKDGMDTSLPSTNSICVTNLFRLGTMLNEEGYGALARETVNAFEVEMMQYAWLFPGLLAGVVKVRLGGKTWAVLGDAEDDEVTAETLRRVNTSPSGGIETIVRVHPGSWVAGKNSLLGELISKQEKGCFFLDDGGSYRPASARDLEPKPRDYE
jgi:uncharacterized protein YyaL (SSP411 family)